MSFRTRLALSLLSGLLDPLGYTGFGLFPLTWFAKVPVLLAVHDLPPRRAFSIAMVYGAVAYFGGYYWLGHTFSIFGGFSALAAWSGAFFVCACLGLSFGLMMALTQVFRSRGIAPVWSLAFVNPAIELLFPNIFPYNIGASQYRFTAITQIVEITGLLGLTALIALVNGAVYELVESRYQRRACLHRRWIIPLAAFVLVLGYGMLRIHQIDRRSASARQLTVALIQANLSRQTQGKAFESFREHHALTWALTKAAPPPELVIWPETTIKLPLRRDVTTLPGALRQPMPLLAGAVTRTYDSQPFNSLLAITPTGEITSRYDKRSLLAFGEMIPFEKQFPSLRQWLPRTGNLVAGKSLGHLHAVEATFLPTICYEDIQPARIREIWQHAGPAHALVNVTNDAWFGDTHEPRTHHALATFRAIETRRALIRSTTTGISALVDPTGRVLAQTGQHTRETLIGTIPLIADGSTTLYMRYGDWFGWLCVVFTFAGLFRARKRHLTFPDPVP
ncbi:MAG: apolipoprotein N-acyltransferase [Verrucomicrobiaceae bacterium]|nr:apolipoprotein N-acyltransferase [Verrucomicrobiaceae bacterium]